MEIGPHDIPVLRVTEADCEGGFLRVNPRCAAEAVTTEVLGLQERLY